ncbi:glycosyltransferase family 2 protein [Rheinheimera sp. UJ63]|uniref:glycosyltransferase family 2 protein n=1 Tax=Rheinheimera sp. UJ63 TaxID=2910157 RepID=UPI001F36DE5A|nr:glycosyltransferase family 2 protein [Rheinheimera sp. UJ63]MCF4007810.1 glycosyltransferase family 2 protein [Rheinheimera sp. UJ63]
MTLILILTVICLLIPLYVYCGYPLLLWLLSRLKPALPEPAFDRTKKVTLVVSCYNEAGVIAEKLENALALDYPKELLDILVLSDGSDDDTDTIVKSFADHGVRLLRQEGRLGKTMGLNMALEHTDADYVVFSDANAMYQIDAILQLVRFFQLPEVGYVVGAALYTDGKDNAAAANEDLYWRYELKLKLWESRLHSVVGGDGAIYAIRRSLWQPLQQKDINDFVNPLQIVAQGYRGIFTPTARCYEETAGDFTKEAKRKERIVNRSVRGLMRVKAVMNPFYNGWFSFEVISHKLLRWLLPYFACIGLVGSAFLAAQQQILFQLVIAGALLVFIAATIGGFRRSSPSLAIWFAMPYYLLMVNYFAMRGVVKALQGQTQVTWSSVRPSNQVRVIPTESGLPGLIVVVILFTICLMWPYV